MSTSYIAKIQNSVSIKNLIPSGTRTSLKILAIQGLNKNQNQATAFNQKYDPYFINVSLLLHFDRFPLIDSSLNNWPLTLNTTLSTSSECLNNSNNTYYFNSSNSYITVNSPFTLGTQSFTIEGYFYINAGVTGYQYIIGNSSNITNINNWYISASASSKLLTFYCYNNNIIQTQQISVIENIKWYHFAYVKNNNNFSIYINGNSIAYTTFPSTIDGNITAGNVLYIGGTSATNTFNGYLDEIRVTNGVARYTQNFKLNELRVPYPSIIPLSSFKDNSRLYSPILYLDANYTANPGCNLVLNGIGPDFNTSISNDPLYKYFGSTLTSKNVAGLQLGDAGFTIIVFINNISASKSTLFYSSNPYPTIISTNGTNLGNLTISTASLSNILSIGGTNFNTATLPSGTGVYNMLTFKYISSGMSFKYNNQSANNYYNSSEIITTPYLSNINSDTQKFGNIASILAYNNVLSDSQINDIYNRFSGRFNYSKPSIGSTILENVSISAVSKCVGAYGLFLLSSSYTGPVVKIKSNNTPTLILDLYADIYGNLGTAYNGTGQSFSNIMSASINDKAVILTLYDQSGKGNHASNISANPVYINPPSYNNTINNIDFTANGNGYLNLPDGTVPSGNSPYNVTACYNTAGSIPATTPTIFTILGSGLANMSAQNTFAVGNVGINTNIGYFYNNWTSTSTTTPNMSFTNINGPNTISYNYDGYSSIKTTVNYSTTYVTNPATPRASITTNNYIGTNNGNMFFNGKLTYLFIFNSNLSQSDTNILQSGPALSFAPLQPITGFTIIPSYTSFAISWNPVSFPTKYVQLSWYRTAVGTNDPNRGSINIYNNIQNYNTSDYIAPYTINNCVLYSNTQYTVTITPYNIQDTTNTSSVSQTQTISTVTPTITNITYANKLSSFNVAVQITAGCQYTLSWINSLNSTFTINRITAPSTLSYTSPTSSVSLTQGMAVYFIDSLSSNLSNVGIIPGKIYYLDTVTATASTIGGLNTYTSNGIQLINLSPTPISLQAVIISYPISSVSTNTITYTNYLNAASTILSTGAQVMFTNSFGSILSSNIYYINVPSSSYTTFTVYDPANLSSTLTIGKSSLTSNTNIVLLNNNVCQYIITAWTTNTFTYTNLQSVPPLYAGALVTFQQSIDTNISSNTAYYILGSSLTVNTFQIVSSLSSITPITINVIANSQNVIMTMTNINSLYNVTSCINSIFAFKQVPNIQNYLSLYNGAPVQFGGVLIGGTSIKYNTIYYIANFNQTSSQFQISSTPGGSPLTLTTTPVNNQTMSVILINMNSFTGTSQYNDQLIQNSPYIITNYSGTFIYYFTSASGLIPVGTRVQFYGTTLPANITQGTTYYILTSVNTILGSNLAYMTIGLTSSGTAISLSSTGSTLSTNMYMTIVYSSTLSSSALTITSPISTLSVGQIVQLDYYGIPNTNYYISSVSATANTYTITDIPGGSTLTNPPLSTISGSNTTGFYTTPNNLVPTQTYNIYSTLYNNSTIPIQVTPLLPYYSLLLAKIYNINGIIFNSFTFSSNCTRIIISATLPSDNIPANVTFSGILSTNYNSFTGTEIISSPSSVISSGNISFTFENSISGYNITRGSIYNNNYYLQIKGYNFQIPTYSISSYYTKSTIGSINNVAIRSLIYISSNNNISFSINFVYIGSFSSLSIYIQSSNNYTLVEKNITSLPYNYNGSATNNFTINKYYTIAIRYFISIGTYFEYNIPVYIFGYFTIQSVIGSYIIPNSNGPFDAIVSPGNPGKYVLQSLNYIYFNNTVTAYYIIDLQQSQYDSRYDNLQYFQYLQIGGDNLIYSSGSSADNLSPRIAWQFINRGNGNYWIFTYYPFYTNNSTNPFNTSQNNINIPIGNYFLGFNSMNKLAVILATTSTGYPAKFTFPYNSSGSPLSPYINPSNIANDILSIDSDISASIVNGFTGFAPIPSWGDLSYPLFYNFTSGKTYNITFNINFIADFIMVGGGGGGGGLQEGSTNAGGRVVACGGGGGSGAVIYIKSLLIAAGDKITITVGTGGIGGVLTRLSYDKSDGKPGTNTELSLNGNLNFIANGGQGGIGGQGSEFISGTNIGGRGGGAITTNIFNYTGTSGGYSFQGSPYWNPGYRLTINGGNGGSGYYEYSSSSITSNINANNVNGSGSYGFTIGGYIFGGGGGGGINFTDAYANGGNGGYGSGGTGGYGGDSYPVYNGQNGKNGILCMGLSYNIPPILSPSSTINTFKYNPNILVKKYTIPTNGNYLIIAAGASSGIINSPLSTNNNSLGGRGVIISNTFNLMSGTLLTMVLGECPGDGSYGGGGTFVATGGPSYDPLIIAGGGGGSGGVNNTIENMDAVLTTSGGAGRGGGLRPDNSHQYFSFNGGTDGNTGQNSTFGGSGGGGFSSFASYVNSPSGISGFGGQAQMSGGGGYSGGGGGGAFGYDLSYEYGGGGGSYDKSSLNNNATTIASAQVSIINANISPYPSLTQLSSGTYYNTGNGFIIIIMRN